MLSDVLKTQFLLPTLRVGTAKAQISDIVRAAGVAYGSFYAHFDGKEDVLRECCPWPIDVAFRGAGPTVYRNDIRMLSPGLCDETKRSKIDAVRNPEAAVMASIGCTGSVRLRRAHHDRDTRSSGTRIESRRIDEHALIGAWLRLSWAVEVFPL